MKNAFHCVINSKSDVELLEHQKAFKVEYTKRGGYWAVWIAGYSVQDVKTTFIEAHPDCEYLRSKRS